MPLVTGADFGIQFPTGNTNDISPIVRALQGEIQLKRQRDLVQKQEQAQTLQKAFKTTALNLLDISKKGSFVEKRTAILKMAKDAQVKGNDSQIFNDLLSVNNNDELDTAILQIARRAGDADKQLESALEQQFDNPETNKLQFGGQEIVKDESDNLFFTTSRRNPQTGAVEAVLSPIGHENEPTGKIQLTNSAGLTPEQRIDLQKQIDANKSKIEVGAAGDKKTAELEAEKDIKPQTEKKVQLAKASAKKANRAFDEVDKIQANILNLQDAIDVVKSGAGTGPLEKLLPSVRASSVALDNIQGRLGLDVVGATTFGALSKGELDLAKAVALPTGLDGPELINWVEKKIAAQEKLRHYFEEQAIFLSEGNSQADWIKFKKEQSSAAPEPASTPNVGRFQIEVIE